jgi:prepilin-type N-terminal cleavage/methylation domain-containing protein
MKDVRSGFTIIEAIIAILILGVALSFIIPAFIANLQINSRSEKRTYAVAAAQQVLENLRLENPQNLPSSGSGAAVNVLIGGNQYVVTPSYCTIANLCTSTSKYIRVDVTFDSKILYSAETVFAKIANP